MQNNQRYPRLTQKLTLHLGQMTAKEQAAIWKMQRELEKQSEQLESLALQGFLNTDELCEAAFAA